MSAFEMDFLESKSIKHYSHFQRRALEGEFNVFNYCSNNGMFKTKQKFKI